MSDDRLRQRLAAYTTARLVVATVLLGLAVAVEVRAPGAVPFNPLLALIGFAFAASLVLLTLQRLVDQRPWLADLHFGLDAVLISAGVYLTGGVNSLFTPLYALPVLSASTAPLRRGGLRMATLNAVLFVGVVLAQYEAARGSIVLPLVPGPRDLPTAVVALYTVGLNVFGFFAVAILAGSLAERARRADVQLVRVTERIADLEAFNAYVIDSLVSGLATADAANRILTFNRSASTIVGVEAAAAVGRPAPEVLQFDPGWTATLEDDLKQARSKRLDFRFRRLDGREIDLGLSVAGLPLPDGSRGFIYTFQDVTEIKRLERDARMRQRLAAVGEMAAGLAHEIRNPLASMSGSMQMLRRELRLSGDQAQLMDIVLKESERLNDTIRSFLTYARPTMTRLAVLDLRTLVSETAILLRNSPDVRVCHTVTVSIPETPVPAEGDEAQLRQILWNLATNALRAMPDGGALELAARVEPDAAGRSQAVLEVVDHGVGMSADELDHIFQPFRGSFGQGTGLGLAIVHRIVTDYGGRIDVRSEPGRGSTFTVRFPGPPPAAADPVVRPESRTA